MSCRGRRLHSIQGLALDGARACAGRSTCRPTRQARPGIRRKCNRCRAVARCASASRDLGRQAGVLLKPLHRRNGLHAADPEAIDRHSWIERSVRRSTPQRHPKLGRQSAGDVSSCLCPTAFCGLRSWLRCRTVAFAQTMQGHYGFGTTVGPQDQRKMQTLQTSPTAADCHRAAGNVTAGAESSPPIPAPPMAINRRATRQGHRRRSSDRRSGGFHRQRPR